MRRTKTKVEELADAAADYMEIELVSAMHLVRDSGMMMERHILDDGIEFRFKVYFKYETEGEEDEL